MRKVTIIFENDDIREFELKEDLNTTTIDGFIGVVYEKEYNGLGRVTKRKMKYFNTDNIKQIWISYKESE